MVMSELSLTLNQQYKINELISFDDMCFFCMVKHIKYIISTGGHAVILIMITKAL